MIPDEAPFVSSQGHKASMALNPALSETFGLLAEAFQQIVHVVGVLFFLFQQAFH